MTNDEYNSVILMYKYIYVVIILIRKLSPNTSNNFKDLQINLWTASL